MTKIIWWVLLVFIIWVGLRTAAAVAAENQAPFVILYPSGQAAWIQILANVIETLPLYQDSGNRTFASLMWVYSHTETANKHIPEHWEAMWNFKCGRTAGRWPWCGGNSNKVDLDPQDPTSAERRKWTQGHFVYGLKHSKTAPENHPVHRHHRPKPLACGFGISLDILTPDLMDYFVKRKIHVIILTPGNPVLSAMLMLSGGGINHHQKQRIIHRLYCSGDDSGQSLIQLIQTQQIKVERDDILVSDLRDHGMPVFVQDGPEFFLVPQVSLGLIYEFVFDAEAGHMSLSQRNSLVISAEIKQEIYIMMTPNPQVLLDCVTSLEAVKLFYVITSAAGNASKSIVESLTELLSLIDLIEKLPAEKVSRIWKTRSDVLTLMSEEGPGVLMNSNRDTWAKGRKRRRHHRA